MDREEAEDLLRERATRRAARDFPGADALRDRLREGGWEVVDGAAGSELRALEPPPAALTVTIMTIVHGWPEDGERWLGSVLAHPPAGESWEILVVDNSGNDSVADWLSGHARDVVAILPPQPTGFGAAANLGLASAHGQRVILFDPGVELDGEVVAPLVAALEDPEVAAAGPFGLRIGTEGKELEIHSGPDVEALEGYCLAFRRAEAMAAGGFDEKFAFYRIADIELTFRLREGGRRARVVPVPVTRHAHRLWEATEPAERQRLSRKNFYRFWNRWGSRPDMRVTGD